MGWVEELLYTPVRTCATIIAILPILYLLGKLQERKKQHGKSPDSQSVVFRGPEKKTHSQLLTKVNIYGTGNHFKCTLFM